MVDESTNEIWTDDRLDEVIQWIEEAYPEEGCGLVLEDKETGRHRVKPTQNLANQYHEMDPEKFPRTAEKFYVINPMEFVRAEDRGEQIAVVFHSHVDAGDYFSEEDVKAATLPRDSEDAPYEQSHPGADYLVVSVRDGDAECATLYRFHEDVREEPYRPALEVEITEDGYERTAVSG